MRTFLSIIAGCIMLVGCAATPPSPHESEEVPWQQVKTQIPPGSSLLYVVRPANLSSSANRYKIRINGVHVADMQTGSYFSYQVPAGDVNISAETVPSFMNFGLALAMMGKPSLVLTTIPGEIYFVNVGVAFSGGPTLSVVESEKGKSLVTKAKKTETLQNQD